jgi:rod shape-determining protein MreD
MKYRYAFLIFFAAFTLQSTLIRYIAVKNVAPNLLLCLVAVFSFLYEDYYGMVMGVIFGIIWDLSLGPYAGVTGVAFLAAALTASFLKRYWNHEHALPDFFASLLGTVAYVLVFWLTYKLAGVPHSAIYILKRQPIFFAYNAIFSIIFHWIFARSVIRHRMDRRYKGVFEPAKNFRL